MACVIFLHNLKVMKVLRTFLFHVRNFFKPHDTPAFFIMSYLLYVFFWIRNVLPIFFASYRIFSLPICGAFFLHAVAPFSVLHGDFRIWVIWGIWVLLCPSLFKDRFLPNTSDFISWPQSMQYTRHLVALEVYNEYAIFYVDPRYLFFLPQYPLVLWGC